LERTLSSYKLSLSKKWLLLIFGAGWFFASSILMRSGTFYMFDYSHHILFNLAIGFLVGLIFFAFLFYKIVRSNVNRILKSENEKIGVLFYIGFKDSIIVAVLISFGLVLYKFHYIDMMNLHVFYICMGTAIFFASLKFFYSLIFYKKRILSNAGGLNS
jgi:hypothetical protein